MLRRWLLVLVWVALGVTLSSCGQSGPELLGAEEESETPTPNIEGEGFNSVTDVGAANDGFVCAGGGGPDSTTYGSYVRCFDAAGQLLWQKVYNDLNNTSDIGKVDTWVQSVQVTTDGEVYVLEQEYASSSAEQKKYTYVHRYRPSGVLEWSRLVSDSGGTDADLSLVGDAVQVALQLSKADGSTVLRLVRYNHDGNIVWNRTVHQG